MICIVVGGVLDYNTGKWCRYDDDIITNYSGYPENIYDDLSHESGKKGINDYYEWIR